MSGFVALPAVTGLNVSLLTPFGKVFPLGPVPLQTEFAAALTTEVSFWCPVEAVVLGLVMIGFDLTGLVTGRPVLIGRPLLCPLFFPPIAVVVKGLDSSFAVFLSLIENLFIWSFVFHAMSSLVSVTTSPLDAPPPNSIVSLAVFGRGADSDLAIKSVRAYMLSLLVTTIDFGGKLDPAEVRLRFFLTMEAMVVVEGRLLVPFANFPVILRPIPPSFPSCRGANE
jgi:hypothetical protein